MPFFRYTLPVIPLLIILCQIFSSTIWHSFSSKEYGKYKLAFTSVVALVIFFAAEQFFYDLSFNRQWNEINEYAMHNQKTFGEWIRREIGSDSLIAIGDVGRFAFFSQAKILDLFGLASREVAQLRKTHGAPKIILPNCAISFDAYKEEERRLLLKLLPDYIFFYNARLKITDTFPGSFRGIADDIDFKAEYEYMGSFSVVPKFTSSYWPRRRYFIDILDLSAGLLSWMIDGWGYEIYIRKESHLKRFNFEFAPDGKIEQITSNSS
jgi:hypothetical protein